MSGYSYKTVAAPRRLKKIKGVKGKDALLARTVEDLIAVEAAQGWEYQRADMFPVDEKSGFFSKSSTEMRAVLIFRKAAPSAQPQVPPQPVAQTMAAASPQAPQPHPAAARSEPAFSDVEAQPARTPHIGGAND